MQEEPATPEQGAELCPSPVQPISTFSDSKMGTGFPARPARWDSQALRVCASQTAVQFLPCSQREPGQPPPPCSLPRSPGGPLLQGRYCAGVASAPPVPGDLWPLCAFHSVYKQRLSSGRPGSFGCWILSQPQLYFGKSKLKGLFQHAVGYCRNTTVTLMIETS